jgi:pimeloyl-ACP methyl ester carboxylesterase
MLLKSTKTTKLAQLTAAVLVSAAAILVLPSSAVATEREPQTALSYAKSPTQFIEAHGVRFAYRKVGAATGIPVILLHHWAGNLDDWDPGLVDGISRDRPVIAFDYTGVGATDGKAPETIEDMAGDVVFFIQALGLKKVDLVGFSIGGFAAQVIAASQPDLVRRVVIAGSDPKGAEGLKALQGTYSDCVKKSTETKSNIKLCLFFGPSETSQAAGRAFIERLQERVSDRDKPVSAETATAQLKAVMAWSEPTDPQFSLLSKIKQPVLVADGNHDIMALTINSYTLSQHLPDAKLVLYPDSGTASYGSTATTSPGRSMSSCPPARSTARLPASAGARSSVP